MSFDRQGFYHEVGKLLRHHRNARELTQEDIATKLEMPRSTYANIERGRQRAPADVVWRVSVLLGVSVDSLLPSPKLGEDLPDAVESHLDDLVSLSTDTSRPAHEN